MSTSPRPPPAAADDDIPPLAAAPSHPEPSARSVTHCVACATQRMDPLGVTITSFVIVSIGSFLISVLMGGMDTFKLWELTLQQDVIVPLLCLGLLGSLFALLLLNLLQRYLHPVQAAIIYGLEPVWATMFALGLGLSDWSGWIAIGGSALLLGNVLVELRQSTHAEEE